MGPVDGFAGRTHSNGVYGYRVPKDGKLLGFTVDFCETPRDGVFQVFYWYPNTVDSDNNSSWNGKADFALGGPIVSQTSEMQYASGSTQFKAGEELKVRKDGFIFAVADNSYIRDPNGISGSNADIFADEVNDGFWTDPANPVTPTLFLPPQGQTQITVYVRFDNTN